MIPNRRVEPYMVVLRNEHSPKGSRHLSARITEAGDLSIEGQDLGPGVEEAWGGGLTEYEWAIVVRRAHLPQVIVALGGKEDVDVLSLLAARFSDNEQCTSRSFLAERGIPVEFWNRVGE